MFLAFVIALAGEPKLSDLKSFPPMEDCRKAITENEKFCKALAAKNAKEKNEGARKRGEATLAAGVGLRKFWQYLAAAHDDKRTEERRLVDLRALRKLLGADWYDAGRMPYWIPAELLAPPKEDK